MIADFTAWLIDLVIRGLKAVFDMLTDLFIALVEIVLLALSSLLGAIPAPDFLQNYSLTSLLSGLPPDVLFFVDKLNLPGAMGIIAGGFGFYLLRKIFTLGQW